MANKLTKRNKSRKYSCQTGTFENDSLADGGGHKQHCQY